MRLTMGLLIAAVFVGCRPDAAPVPAGRSGPVSAAGASATSLEASAESRAVAAADVNAPGTLEGAVLETMDAGGYTYLRLETPTGPKWAAVNPSKVRKGARVTVLDPLVMEGFESRTLQRRFDRIVFGTLAAEAAPGRGSGMSDTAARHAAAASEPADVGRIEVPRASAPEGRTVSEVFAQRASLDGRSVAVRGKVVKFLPGILGRNWLHLRDGTGSPERKDHDLTVTTTDTTAVGEVVLVKGIARQDRDFGAGYAYAVILEDSRLSR